MTLRTVCSNHYIQVRSTTCNCDLLPNFLKTFVIEIWRSHLITSKIHVGLLKLWPLKWSQNWFPLNNSNNFSSIRTKLSENVSYEAKMENQQYSCRTIGVIAPEILKIGFCLITQIFFVETAPHFLKTSNIAH